MTSVAPVTIDDVLPRRPDVASGPRIAVVVPLNFPDFTTETAAQQLTVRNGHHQAVGDVAPELTVAARGLDGVVEAVEHRDPHCWVLGVQWHPEDNDGSDYSRRALFGALLEQAAAYQSCCPTG